MVEVTIDKRSGSHRWRQFCLGSVLFISAWGLAIAVTYIVVAGGFGHWLELFNGATWPQQFVPTSAGNRVEPIRTFWFYCIVSFRTILNLGVILTAAFALYLLLTGQLKEWLMSNLESVLTTRDTALAAFIIHKMKEQDLALTPEQCAGLYKAADEFQASNAGRAFLKSSRNAAGSA